MNAKHESMMGILRLYELRRDDTMRKAREWFSAFRPTTTQEIFEVVGGQHSAYFRMVTSYWEMAASFVNHGAIDEQMFNDTTLEHVAVFSKIEPFLAEIRSISGSQEYLAHLEQLVMGSERLRAIVTFTREQLKARTERAEGVRNP